MRRRVEKLAAVQTSAVPIESNSGNRCLNPQSPVPCSLSDQIHGEAHEFKLYLSGSTAGSEKRVGKSTTSLGLSSCGRLDSLLPTRRRQVHPQSDTTGGLEAKGGVRFCFFPLSRNHFRRFFPLGYSPPWLVRDQTITFHRVLNNEKRWVFLFCCRRTHPSG